MPLRQSLTSIFSSLETIIYHIRPLNFNVIVKNRVDYYLLHTYVCAYMGIRSAHQHKIVLSQILMNKLLKFGLWSHPNRKAHTAQEYGASLTMTTSISNHASWPRKITTHRTR